MSSGNDSNSSGNRHFATTQWSIVRAVGNHDPKAAKSALEKLCQVYWYPLYTFVRYQGHDGNKAADLTQAFFADLLEREDLKRVDPTRGKFRSFLLASMKHFLINQWNKEKAQKRGGGRQIFSLDFSDADSKYRAESLQNNADANGKTPEQLFEKQWAITLLERTSTALRKEFELRGKAHQFDKLQIFLAGKTNEDTMQSMADQLAMSEVAVKVAVHRMRKRYGELLRLEIAHTVSEHEEIEDEIQHLFDVLKK